MAGADVPAEFYRGINLNGPPVVIDGRQWEGEANGGVKGVECPDGRFESQDIPLWPETDADRARMIRSSVWDSGGKARILIKDLPAGEYSVFLYLWEDNDSQTFDVFLQGKPVAQRVESGSGGKWQRLGPWPVQAADGRIELTTAGGHANLSGIELWKGKAPATSVPTIKPPPLPTPKTTDKRAGYDWWSFRPVARPNIPQVKNAGWVRNPIDAFVLARLEREGLAPSPEVERRTLIRRVTFDLTGLPPAPDEVDAFVLDNRPDAYERLVDRLLACPRYGERWARHWLDVVRFGDSQGFERNHYRPDAWKYRDWVIASLNADLPYDEFVRQQIAGDVLEPQDPMAVAATGYLVCGAYDFVGQTEGTETMKRVSRQDQLEDFVGNLGQTFLGLTVNCARCHDHKFDPVAQREYYQVAAALAGVFDGDRETLGDKVAAKARRQSLSGKIRALRAKMEPIDAAIRRRLGERLLADAREAAKKAEKRAEDKARASAEKPDDKGRKEASDSAKKEVEARRAEVARLEQGDAAARAVTDDQVLAELPADKREAYAALVAEVSESEALDRLLAGGPAHVVTPQKPELTRVLARGDVKQPGEVVAPGGPVAVGIPGDFGLPPDAPEDARRRKLAEWVTDLRNPLPARVIVNRLWHYHFGAGIVNTPNDFGFNGGRPSHPELLDWLASELVANQWSLKKLHRTILLSATYRQSSAPRAEPLAKDAGNRLLWRKAPARLEAEALRDTMLAVAGELNPRMGGPGFQDFDMPPQQGKNQVYVPRDVAGPEFDRRTIYRASPRSGGNALLATLDCPDPSVATPARTVTTTPLQALSLMNNALMVRMSERFAERLKREAGDDLAKQIERAYALAYGRRPDVDEAEVAGDFVNRHGMAQLCLVLFNASEFVYVD